MHRLPHMSYVKIYESESCEDSRQERKAVTCFTIRSHGYTVLKYKTIVASLRDN